MRWCVRVVYSERKKNECDTNLYLQFRTLKITVISRWRHQGRVPPSESKFFDFDAVFGEKLAKIVDWQPTFRMTTLLWKILDPPLPLERQRKQNKRWTCAFDRCERSTWEWHFVRCECSTWDWDDPGCCSERRKLHFSYCTRVRAQTQNSWTCPSLWTPKQIRVGSKQSTSNRVSKYRLVGSLSIRYLEPCLSSIYFLFHTSCGFYKLWSPSLPYHASRSATGGDKFDYHIFLDQKN